MFAIEYLAPNNVSWLSTLGVFSVHTKEPIFYILSHFKSVWLGFESLKVCHLLLSCWCKLFWILGGPFWLVITLTQLTKMRKFLLNCILEVIDLLCFNFELMMNPFDQFLNMIPNAICNFYWCHKVQIRQNPYSLCHISKSSIDEIKWIIPLCSTLKIL